MSHVDNQHVKNYVITYKELLFTLIVFSVILIVLYPKDLIKNKILSEKSNYDLSMLYLQNLLQHDPSNEQLMLILAEQSLRSNKKDLSLRLLELLLESEVVAHRDKATLLSYELQKDDYFYIQDPLLQIPARKKLQILFEKIFSKKMYDDAEYDKWYEEAVFADNKAAMYYFLKKKLEKDPTNNQLLENAYYLAIASKEYDRASKYVDLLIQNDKEQHEKWLLDKYYMLVNAQNDQKIQAMLEEEATRSKAWKTRLAEYYLMRRSYKASSDAYLALFNEESDYTQKKNYFFKAIGALQAGNLLSESAALAKKYEHNYIRDKEARKLLLKVYMATNNLDHAAALSEKILKEKMR
ncbi:MAG: hypothetical protein WBK95_11360 [Sulfurimonas sp.]